MISVMGEQFRRNQRSDDVVWAVEHWTYSVDGHYVTDVTNNFVDEGTVAAAAVPTADPDYGDSSSTNGNSSAKSVCSRRRRPPAANDLPESDVQVAFTADDIPLANILFLICDMLVRLVLPLPLEGRIEAPVFPQGYKWQTRKSNALLALEIIDTSLPPDLYPFEYVTWDLFYSAVLCELLTKWVGDREWVEGKQKSFEARFNVLDVDWDYARVTVEEVEEGMGVGVGDADVDGWLGADGSLVSGLGAGGVAELARGPMGGGVTVE